MLCRMIELEAYCLQHEQHSDKGLTSTLYRVECVGWNGVQAEEWQRTLCASVGAVVDSLMYLGVDSTDWTR